MRHAKNLFALWDSFWFAPMDLYGVSLVRFLLSGAWLTMYSIRFFNFTAFFGDQGIVPGAVGNLILPKSHLTPVPFYFISETYTYYAHILYLVLLGGLFLGVFSRSLTWLVFVLHLGFMQRNFSIVYGADLFSSFWLLYLSLIKHNQYFSVWNWVRPKNSDRINLPKLDSDLLSSVGVRFIQLQLCISYVYTGIEKLKGNLWWEGEAVWHVLGMRELLSVDLTALQSFPVVIALLTITTVIFEIYFPAAILNEKVKPFWLLIGVSFHGLTAIFLGIPFFCLVMITPYILFFDTKSVRFFVTRVKDFASSLVPQSRPQS